MNQEIISLDRVLLVDDDTTSLYIAKRLMKDVVREPILTAKDGVEALKILKECLEKQQLPQLILSTVFMPVMNGMAFTEELQSLLATVSKHIRVVLFSEKTNIYVAQWAKQHPYIPIIEKPLTRVKVLDVLAELNPA